MAVLKRQPLRHSSKEHAEAVKEEVNKLKQVGVIKEAFYPEWLTNTVVVKKKSGKWRVCVDFIDFNKASPKDVGKTSFPSHIQNTQWKQQTRIYFIHKR